MSTPRKACGELSTLVWRRLAYAREGGQCAQGTLAKVRAIDTK